MHKGLDRKGSGGFGGASVLRKAQPAGPVQALAEQQTAIDLSHLSHRACNAQGHLMLQ